MSDSLLCNCASFACVPDSYRLAPWPQTCPPLFAISNFSRQFPTSCIPATCHRRQANRLPWPQTWSPTLRSNKPLKLIQTFVSLQIATAGRQTDRHGHRPAPPTLRNKKPLKLIQTFVSLPPAIAGGRTDCHGHRPAPPAPSAPIRELSLWCTPTRWGLQLAAADAWPRLAAWQWVWQQQQQGSSSGSCGSTNPAGECACVCVCVCVCLRPHMPAL